MCKIDASFCPYILGDRRIDLAFNSRYLKRCIRSSYSTRSSVLETVEILEHSSRERDPWLIGVVGTGQKRNSDKGSFPSGKPLAEEPRRLPNHQARQGKRHGEDRKIKPATAEREHETGFGAHMLARACSNKVVNLLSLVSISMQLR